MQLSLMTWNIHRAIGMDRRFRPQRIIDVIRHHRPDVVLLQEVDRGVPRSQRLFLDHLIAEQCHYPYHTWAQAHVLQEGSYGNATLSRVPLLKRRVFDLTVGRRKRRNALYTKLRMPRSRRGIHLFNWHLGLSAMERRQQVAKLLQSSTVKQLGETKVVILGGDTNDWRNLLFRGAGLEAEGFDAWSEHGRRKPLRTYPSPRPLGALDKFFWRGPMRAEHFHTSRLAVARIASDHLPLLAQFYFG